MGQLAQLFNGFTEFKPQFLIMYAIGGILIYLAIKKEYEPTLLLPIGFGCIIVNLPLRSIWQADPLLDQTVTDLLATNPELTAYFTENLHYIVENGQAFKVEPGLMQILYNSGILTELFPCLIFIAVGAMIDFSPLLKNPKLIFCGAAAQFGIFLTILLALLLGKVFPSLGFDLKAAASIGIIGAADGPTSIYVAARFAPQFLGAISVAAYSYMSLVPIIQPPIIKLTTTKKERMIRMDYHEDRCSKTVLILFPIVVTVVAGILVPMSAPLVGSLMFGNLIRECGVLNSLSETAQKVLANLITIFLGISIAFNMHAAQFLKPQTLLIMGLGLVAFIFDTAGGVLVAKFLNLFLPKGRKINPMIGAAGISAFPMSSRVIHKMGLKEDPQNFLLMHTVGVNVSGQIASVIAGGLIMSLVYTIG